MALWSEMACLLRLLKRNIVSPKGDFEEEEEQEEEEDGDPTGERRKEEKERRRKFLSRLCEQSMKVNKGKLIVRGVLHRAGALNSNGRV